METINPFVTVRDQDRCKNAHPDSPLDRLARVKISTDTALDKNSVFPTQARVVVVDLCKTDVTPAVVAGLTLRNKGYFVIFDLCSHDPTELINDFYDHTVELEKGQPIRGEAIIAEPALVLSSEIEKAIKFFEREFL